jgi:antirestriction factor ArdC-like protein
VAIVLLRSASPFEGVPLFVELGNRTRLRIASLDDIQAVELNAHVRKGQQGSLVVYANKLTKSTTDNDGNEVGNVRISVEK